MPDYSLSEALNDCIDRLSAGQSVEDCVRLYPQYAGSLRPMLEAGLLTRRTRLSAADIAQAQDRVRFKFELSHMAHSKKRRAGTLRLRPAAMVAAVLIVVIGGLIFAAQNSLPGDTLYGLKRMTENVQLALSGESATLRAAQMQHHREDIQRVLDARRVTSVEFEGVIEDRSTINWRISGLNTFVAADLPGTQALKAGDEVTTRATTTSQGTLIATEIRLTNPNTLSPTITPSPSPTLPLSGTPTATPSLTPTARPSVTVTVMRPPATAILPNPQPTNPPVVGPTLAPDPTDDKGGSDSESGGKGSDSSGKGKGGN